MVYIIFRLQLQLQIVFFIVVLPLLFCQHSRFLELEGSPSISLPFRTKYHCSLLFRPTLHHLMSHLRICSLYIFIFNTYPSSAGTQVVLKLGNFPAPLSLNIQFDEWVFCARDFLPGWVANLQRSSPSWERLRPPKVVWGRVHWPVHIIVFELY